MGERHAIILGGGIAGLSCALALRDHFDAITVVEHDPYPDAPGVRPHTPQGHHVHLLLARGLAELVALVPELPQWLDAAGLPEGDLTGDVWLAQAGQWLPRRRCGIAVRPCTRPVLEHLLHRATSRHDHIQLRTGLQVDALIGRERIGGARVLDRAGEPHELRGELVVDACGRNSKVARWLEAAGHGVVEQTIVDAKVSYASCSFKPNAGVDLPCTLMGVTGVLGVDPRMGTIMPAGPGRWLAAVINYVGSAPPKSVVEFMTQAAALAVPDLHALLTNATPCSEVRLYTNNVSRRRHFKRLRSWPERFVVVGDAACTLNPRFGQGMTVAAASAGLLGRMLAEQGQLDGLARRFQRALDRSLNAPWQIASAEDSTWIALDRGTPTLAERVSIGASKRLLETMCMDYDTYVRVNRVAHMLAPMRSLAAPSMLAKLAFPRLRSRGPA